MPDIAAVDAVPLAVSEYTDSFGNQGVESTAYVLSYSPSVEYLNFPTYVNVEEGRALSFNLALEHVTAASVGLNLVSEDGSTQTGELPFTYDSGTQAWSTAPFDLSAFSSGRVNLVFSGSVTITGGIEVTAQELFTESKSFTYSTVLAEVISVTPLTIKEGVKGEVEMLFSADVTSGTVTINNQETRLTGSGRTWTARTKTALSLASDAETVEVAISGFDYNGFVVEPINVAVETDIEWVLTPNQSEVYNQMTAQQVVINGEVIGLGAGTPIEVVATLNSIEIATQNTTVGYNGSWSVIFNLAEHSGNIELVASADRGGVTHSSGALTIVVDTQAPQILEKPTLTPELSAVGGDITLTIDFDEVVKTISYAQLDGVFVNWTTSAPSQQWIGTVTLNELTNTEVTLSFGALEDMYSNQLLSPAEYTYQVKPVVSLDPVTITPDNFSRLKLQGDAKGFGSEVGDIVTVKFINPTDDQIVITETAVIKPSSKRWILNNLDLTALDEAFGALRYKASTIKGCNRHLFNLK
nr:hypothetical protein [Enterovibrio nigricans]